MKGRHLLHAEKHLGVATRNLMRVGLAGNRTVTLPGWFRLHRTCKAGLIKANKGGTAEVMPFVPRGRKAYFIGEGCNMALLIPEGYKQLLSLKETEAAIREVKLRFERELAKKLNLVPISAPLFVRPETGLNDNLNNVERPVEFSIRDIGETRVEIVHSLAKWKRMALQRYEFSPGEGIYTDMNAIRRDEELSNLHSIYVDQWDWEKIMCPDQRNLTFLKTTVSRLYRAFKMTEQHISAVFPGLEPVLPEDISFCTTQELEDKYPDLSPKEREHRIAREKGAVFLMQIGSPLTSGKPHDGRAPDYDDWSLNGDILFWYPLLNRSVEISSMGIRVDAATLKKQLAISSCLDRCSLDYHRMLLEESLPQTIGGGIGQSRLCMFFLKKAHIGEVQAAIWPEEIISACRSARIELL